MRVSVGLLVAGALAATPALAQPPADPIGDILRQRPDGPQPPPPSTTLTAPVRIEETGKSPDGPPTPADLAYDSRLRSSMASAQAFQGPMAGGWTLAADGRDLYALQLNDKDGVIDGAWRDLRRTGALDGSGFIDAVERTDTGLVVRIGERVMTLRPDAGGWAGDLTEDGRRQSVRLRRRP